MTPPVDSDRALPHALLPLAPLIYVAWADGVLTRDELATLREQAGIAKLPRDSRAALRAWLDPDDPPDAADLAALLEQVRADRKGASKGSRAVRAAAADIEAALELPGSEALRALVGPESEEADEDEAETSHTVDAEALYALLDGDSIDVRRRILDILTRPEFAYVDPRDTHAYREQVLAWCRALADEGIGAHPFGREFGGHEDVAGSIAAFETIAYHDLSLLVKYGVHFGLFGGSIWLLGTRHHHERYIRDVATLELPGCFAMTETGHGSNVRDIETVAAYDVATGEFVIHTPNDNARKDYIGNAALHGRLAVVFAQLIAGGSRHGVHAFLVPIRDEDGTPADGIEIEDCGLKGGLNGVDNGRIRFTHVRIPRENLLDRYGSVDADGSYTSPIASPTRRFFTMLGTLVAGRISIACASLSAAKSGLTIAARYTAQRRQFGPEGGAEVPVLDYTTMQLRLLPRLATAFALDFALKALVRQFDRGAEDDRMEIETLGAALKAFASDFALDTLQVCREACGGQGYLAVNRLTTLRADTDVFATFEGANHVLWQLVAKGRLTEYRHQFGELRVWGIARHLGARAATRVAEANPIVRRRTDPEHLLDPDFHTAALRYREERLLASLARRLKSRLDDGMDSFDALNDCQDHAVELGQAFAERYVLDRFHEGVERCPDGPQRRVLEELAALYALSQLERRSAWFLEVGYIETGKARAIRRQINELCGRIRPVAVALTDAFGIPDALLAAPIATSR